MQIQKKDFSWIIPLCIAFLILCNIVVQEIFHKNQEVFNQEPREINKIQNPLGLTNPLKPPPEKESIPYLLPFELRGTIVGNVSLAFICDTQNNKKGLYKLNDPIGDYKITIISPGKVLLEKDGLTYDLLLITHSKKSIEPEIYIDEFGTTVISRLHLVKQLRFANELLAKLKILPIPSANSNRLMGFRIQDVPSGSIVDKVGIKSGDIIYSVEGKELQSMQDAWQVFNTVKQQSRFGVVLLRNDKPLTLKYEIKN
jgi:type II secretion system protein C